MLASLFATCTALGFSGCSDDDNISGTQLYSFGPCPVLRGDNIKIIGANLNSVSKVVFPGEAGAKVEVSEFTGQSADLMEVTVPQEAVPGKLKLVAGATDTITSKSRITYSEPISYTGVSPTTGLVAGDIITITGDYLNNIATVTFGGGAVVEAESFISQERKQIKLAVPLAAISGKITLSDGADTPTLFESEESLEIATATFTSKDKTEVSEGEKITFTGTNLQLVKKVVYPGDIADEAPTASADGAQLTSTVPTGIKSGEVTLSLYSGEAVSAGNIKVPAIEVTGITPSENLSIGDKVTIHGSRLDLVSELQLPGGINMKKGEWAVNNAATELTFTLPQGVVDGTVTIVQNANISISGFKLSLKKEGNVIWTGNIAFGNWGAFLQAAATDDVSKAIDGPGTLTVHFDQDSSSTWWQIRFQYADWSTCWEKTQDGGGIISLDAGATSYSVPVTATDVQHIQSEGFVINGCFITIKSIEFQKN